MCVARKRDKRDKRAPASRSSQNGASCRPQDPSDDLNEHRLRTCIARNNNTWPPVDGSDAPCARVEVVPFCHQARLEVFRLALRSLGSGKCKTLSHVFFFFRWFARLSAHLFIIWFFSFVPPQAMIAGASGKKPPFAQSNAVNQSFAEVLSVNVVLKNSFKIEIS